jgi:polyhydroxybutyrate depolymerase
MRSLVNATFWLLMLAGSPVQAQESAVDVARSRAASSVVPENATQRTLVSSGQERSYWLVRPGTVSGRSAVVFVLHGGAVGDGRQTFRYGFQELGARDGVVTVHPNGKGEGWMDGRDTPYLLQRGAGANDVVFFRDMIDALIAEGVADPKRIYVTGGSNGGMMTMRLACELGDRIAAVAPFIASLPAKLEPGCKPPRPIPILMVSGTADRLMPYDGGAVAAMSGDDRGTVLGASRTFAFWQGRNGCSGEATTQELPDLDPADGTRVRVETGQRCAAPVILYTVEGGGHRLPGEGPRVYADERLNRLSGVSSRDMDGKAIIWAFLMQQKLQ